MKQIKEYKLCSNCRYFIPKRSKIKEAIKAWNTRVIGGNN